MSAITATVDDREVRIGLGGLRADVVDRGKMLSIAGVLMRASVARTFREEGSPAGSWPALALSTLKNKRYKSGHKLLILTGRLFSSITYVVNADTLTIGTNVIYARVQQQGSADRSGGSIGPQAKLIGRGVHVPEHKATRSSFRRKGYDLRADKNGRLRKVRVRFQGPANRADFTVSAHDRHQNIPARPFLVIRPEDPQRIVSGIEAWLDGRMVRIGKVGGA
jgi:phage gpG-like protein